MMQIAICVIILIVSVIPCNASTKSKNKKQPGPNDAIIYPGKLRASYHAVVQTLQGLVDYEEKTSLALTSIPRDEVSCPIRNRNSYNSNIEPNLISAIFVLKEMIKTLAPVIDFVNSGSCPFDFSDRREFLLRTKDSSTKLHFSGKEIMIDDDDCEVLEYVRQNGIDFCRDVSLVTGKSYKDYGLLNTKLFIRLRGQYVGNIDAEEKDPFQISLYHYFYPDAGKSIPEESVFLYEKILDSRKKQQDSGWLFNRYMLSSNGPVQSSFIETYGDNLIKECRKGKETVSRIPDTPIEEQLKLMEKYVAKVKLSADDQQEPPDKKWFVQSLYQLNTLASILSLLDLQYGNLDTTASDLLDIKKTQLHLSLWDTLFHNSSLSYAVTILVLSILITIGVHLVIRLCLYMPDEEPETIVHSVVNDYPILALENGDFISLSNLLWVVLL